MKMSLPQNFKFSASNLQDYLDCPRRFELKYLENIEWPAIENEPVLEREHFIEEGLAFHHSVHQHLIGIPIENITPYIKGQNLSRWWQNFCLHKPHTWYEGLRMPEYKVLVPLGDFLFTGQFDLLIQTPEKKLVLFDWKTSMTKPNKIALQKRVQSRLYPLLLSIIGKHPGHRLACTPEDIHIIYWFADMPESTAIFTYSNHQFEEDQSYFLRLADEIRNCQPGDFQLTAEEKRCLYCQYRSLCDRGISSGNWKESAQFTDFDSAFEIDFESIGEIEY